MPTIVLNEKLTENFTLGEFIASETAARLSIGVFVDDGGAVHSNLKRLASTVLQPIRDQFGPVSITSGFRPPKLNQAIGAGRKSYHQFGLAVDFVAHKAPPKVVGEWVRDSGLDFDKCIVEFDRWVHIQINHEGWAPRGEVLTAKRRWGVPVYKQGIE